MAVKAKAEITLAAITDIQSLTRYYLVQSSTSSAPAKPTTFTPPSGWTTTEPAYDSTGTYSLYITDRTVFSDGTFAYSDVSLSSSYEAAKEAYNTATAAKGIAERATHSPNLTPFGSRSFDDNGYWKNKFSRDGYVDGNGWVWSTERLADGWIHVVVDATGDVNNTTRSGDAVIVDKSPSIKPGELYTFLYEVRNNNSTFAESSGLNSQFYIQAYNNNQFYANAAEEVIEGTIVSSIFQLRTMAPDANVTYRKRFTKYADDGTHATANPTNLMRMIFYVGKGDYIDFEVRISLYEGRYLGDYMPYVISDTTAIEADISAANALAQSAKDTADGKITTFYAASTAVPTATTVGDLWIKTDDGNSLWRWNGTSWVSVDNADIQSALTAAGTAQATADSKIVTFAQASQPTATDVGDIWIDTDNNNKLYRWDGSAWVDVHDPQIAENSDRLDESNARIKELVSDGANLIIGTTYPDASSPEMLPRIFGQTHATRYRSGDILSVAEHGFRVTNDGTGGTYITFGNSAASGLPLGMNGLVAGETYTFSADVTCKQLSKNTNTTTYYLRINYYDDHTTTGTPALNTYKNVISITKNDRGVEKSARCEFTFTIPANVTACFLYICCNRTTASEYQAGDFIELRNIKLEKGSVATPWCSPIDWNEAVTAAQETADGKNTVYYQAEAPSGGTYKTNDIWFDTDNGNKMYMWNGSAWTPEEFGNAAISDLSITNAKIANGTIESAKISNLDAGKITSGTMSAARIKGDELKLGGDNDTDGVMKVYNADGELVGSFTKEGLMAIAGQIGGWGIFSQTLKNEWDLLYSHYRALLSPKEGLWLDQTSLDQGMDPNGVYLDKVEYGLPGIIFTSRREINGAVKTGSSSIIGTFYDLDNEKGGVALGPHLIVEDNGIDDPSTIDVSELYLKSLADNSYVRQPQLIMKGNNVIKNGSTNKNVVLCTIPTAYQSGYYIVPFVTRTFGGTGVPDDAGDFKYAYYNQTSYTVNLKLFNDLTSGVWYDYVYFIYALPKT